MNFKIPLSKWSSVVWLVQSGYSFAPFLMQRLQNRLQLGITLPSDALRDIESLSHQLKESDVATFNEIMVRLTNLVIQHPKWFAKSTHGKAQKDLATPLLALLQQARADLDVWPESMHQARPDKAWQQDRLLRVNPQRSSKLQYLSEAFKRMLLVQPDLADVSLTPFAQEPRLYCVSDAALYEAIALSSKRDTRFVKQYLLYPVQEAYVQAAVSGVPDNQQQVNVEALESLLAKASSSWNVVAKHYAQQPEKDLHVADVILQHMALLIRENKSRYLDHMCLVDQFVDIVKNPDLVKPKDDHPDSKPLTVITAYEAIALLKENVLKSKIDKRDIEGITTIGVFQSEVAFAALAALDEIARHFTDRMWGNETGTAKWYPGLEYDYKVLTTKFEESLAWLGECVQGHATIAANNSYTVDRAMQFLNHSVHSVVEILNKRRREKPKNDENYNPTQDKVYKAFSTYMGNLVPALEAIGRARPEHLQDVLSELNHIAQNLKGPMRRDVVQAFAFLGLRDKDVSEAGLGYLRAYFERTKDHPKQQKQAVDVAAAVLICQTAFLKEMPDFLSRSFQAAERVMRVGNMSDEDIRPRLIKQQAAYLDSFGDALAILVKRTGDGKSRQRGLNMFETLADKVREHHKGKPPEDIFHGFVKQFVCMAHGDKACEKGLTGNVVNRLYRLTHNMTFSESASADILPAFGELAKVNSWYARSVIGTLGDLGRREPAVFTQNQCVLALMNVGLQAERSNVYKMTLDQIEYLAPSCDEKLTKQIEGYKLLAERAAMAETAAHVGGWRSLFMR